LTNEGLPARLQGVLTIEPIFSQLVGCFHNRSVADLNSLALNWQQSIPAAAAGEAVPEPSAIMLLILAATAGCLARRR